MNANFLLPLSPEGLDTLKNIWNAATRKMVETQSNEQQLLQEDEDRECGHHVALSKHVTLKASPFCHESHNVRRRKGEEKNHQNFLCQKELRGWVLDVPCDSPASSLPIPANLFHGVSIALCEASEQEILELMRNIEDTKQRLAVAISNEITTATEKTKCTWARCRPSVFGGHPTSLHHAFREKKEGALEFVHVGEDGSQQATPIIDSEEWTPELSPDGFIGFYHRWQSTNQGNKLLLYCVCQSYLPAACREFADMVFKLGDTCSSGCVALSEEAQWLRSACSRNRARMIARVCKAMRIRVPVVRDYCAVNGGRSLLQQQQDGEEELVAVITNETLHHDVCSIVVDFATKKTLSKKIAHQGCHFEPRELAMVRLLNYCCETRTAFNGVACVMAPWEGLWIFEGINPIQDLALQPLSGVSDFGKPYGDFVLCTSVPRVSRAIVMSQDQRKRGLIYSCGIASECKSHSLWQKPQMRMADADNKEKQQDDEDQTQLASAHYLGMEGLEDIVVQAYHNSIKRKQKMKETVSSTIASCFSLIQEKEHRDKIEDKEYYLTFDEHVLDAMSKLGWSRKQGIVKFMPLACGTFENYCSNQSHF